jgi:hypothetical protein
VAHDSPWPHVPASARPCERGGSVTAHHLAPALLTACLLRSTRSPCIRCLHVRAAPLSHVAATPKLHYPPLPSQPPSSHPTLLSSPFASATAAHIADRASHRYCHRPRAPRLRDTPRRHPQGKLSACATEQPTAPTASSSVWSSRWTVTSVPPLVKQPTPRAPLGYHAPPRPVNQPPRPPYQLATDVLPRSDCHCRGKRYSGEPPLPDAPQTGSPTVGLPIATGPPT